MATSNNPDVLFMEWLTEFQRNTPCSCGREFTVYEANKFLINFVFKGQE